MKHQIYHLQLKSLILILHLSNYIVIFLSIPVPLASRVAFQFVEPSPPTRSFSID